MWIAIGIAAALAALGAIVYNLLIWRRNQAAKAFATVDVFLKMRYDLIPNYVEAVKGYMAHEKEVFGRIAELRALATAGGLSRGQVIGLNDELQTALDGLRVSAEAYPELRSAENARDLQEALTSLEEQIAAARRAYNAAATRYNTALECFPGVLLAAAFRMKPSRLFQAGGAAPDTASGRGDGA